MKWERILALFTVLPVILAGTGEAVSFSDEGPFPIAHAQYILSAPAADGDRIVWIDASSSLFPGSDPAFVTAFSIHSYNTTSQAETLIRDRARNAGSPDIDGELAVWEEERGFTTDIILLNFTSGIISALHTPGFQHSPRVSGSRIVWEEGFDGDRDVWMYDTVSGELSCLAAGKNDCFAPDIDGNTAVWVEQSGRDSYSIVSTDLVSGRQTVLDTATVPVCPRIDGGAVVWEEDRLVRLVGNGVGMIVLAAGQSLSSDAVVDENIAAWSDDGQIVCRELSEMQTVRIGKQHASTRPAVLKGGIAWVEEGGRGDSYIRYQPFSSPLQSVLPVSPAAALTTRAMEQQGGRLREGESAWYVLDVPGGTVYISLDFSWEDTNESLSCTLIGPGGALFHFTDSDDGQMDARVRVSVVSHAEILPGRWYCAVSGDSVLDEAVYSLTWYECGEQ